MNYVLKRVTQALTTVIIVTNVSFFLLVALPGGAVQYLKARAMQSAARGERIPTDLAQQIEAYTNINPHEPAHVQWWNYMTSVLQGDLGESIYFNEPVTTTLAEAVPWTVFVSLTALLLMFFFGILIGALIAFKEGSTSDQVVSVTLTVITSVPYYIGAIVFLYLFAYNYHVFPASGRLSTGIEPGLNLTFILDAWWHAVLPITSTALLGTGGIALSMRSNSISILGSDYLRVARLRGLPTGRIGVFYITRNAVLPMYTFFMIAIGNIFGGSIILERIFIYPGLGYKIFTGIGARDHTLIMGGFLLITTAVIIGVLLADLTYGFIDPRVSQGGNNEVY